MLTAYIIVVLLSLAVASLFLFMYKSENEPFLMYFGFSWFFYTLSLVCLLAASFSGYAILISIKKLFDMYSLLTACFACYRYFRLTIHDYWIRFSIYLAVWFFIALYLHLDPITTILPLLAYNAVLVGNICRLIIKHLQQQSYVKFLGCTLFILWGFLKGYPALFEVDYSILGNMYFIEVLFSSLLSGVVLIFYLVNLRSKLEQTEEKNRIILDNARDAFFYLSLKPKVSFEYITPAIQEITGYGPQSFYNKPTLLLDLVKKEDLDLVNRLFFVEPEKAFPTAEVVRFVTRNGDRIWIEINGSLIREGDEIVAVDGYFRNIDQVKNAQDELIESKNSQELMFSYISHELKTPVTVVLGYATALKDGTLTSEEGTRDAIETICEKSMVLERMIMDLSLLSQLQTKQYSFNYEYMSCGDLSEIIKKTVTPDLLNSGIRYTFDIDKDSLRGLNVIVDSIRISQVMSNLIVNSIKYTRPKNHIRIKISSDKPKNHVIITLSDKGIGISSEDLPHVFESFFKSSDAKKSTVQGRGLGLAISKEIIEAHNGEITVRSREGKGTTFQITLPVQQ